MSAILSLSTLWAIAPENPANIGGGNPVAWANTDVVSVQTSSNMTPATESLERNLFSNSFISCKSLTGTESTSGSMDLELGLKTVTGTEAGKLKGHLIFLSGLGRYVEQGADCSVANVVTPESDPVLNPTGWDLYTLSKPNDAQVPLVIREYLGSSGSGTNDNVLEHGGVFVDSIAFNFSAGQISTASASVSGVSYSVKTGQTNLTNLGCGSTPFVTKNCVFKVDGLAVKAQDVTLTISNTNTDRAYVTSSGVGAKITTAKSVELSYTIDLEDLSAYTKLKNATEAELFIELVNGTESMRIYLPRISLTSVDKAEDGGVLTLNLTSMALEDATIGETLLIATKK